MTRAPTDDQASMVTAKRSSRSPHKRWATVRLTSAEREQLDAGLAAGCFPTQSITRIRIILLMDLGNAAADVATLVGVTTNTVIKWKRAFLLFGLDGLLRPRRQARRRKYAQDIDVQILALAREAPPAGQRWWTAKLIAARLSNVPHKLVSRLIKLAGLDLRAGRRRVYRY